MSERASHQADYLLAIVPIIFIALFSFAHADAPSVCPFSWGKNLKVGSSGADVLALQKLLNSASDTRIADAGAGSPGNESDTFGSRTKTAVIKFQEKYASEILVPAGLSKGTGMVGVSTRAKLNALCGVAAATSAPANSSVTIPAAAAAPVLTVSTASQPARTLAPKGAIYVPFTNVTLTAGSIDVTVNSVTVRRTGLSKNGAFAALDLLYDDGTYVTTAYLRSDNMAQFKKSFTIPAGTSKTISVTAEMATDLTDFDGQQASFAVTAIDASVSVAGTFPITGTSQIINNSLTIGETTTLLSSFDPGTDQTRYIHDTGIRFAGIRITAGSGEAVRLDSITWDQAGTAGSSDIANVATVIDGVRYPADADGRYYTSVFPEGITIPKGQTIDLYAEGDLLATGAGRTVKFDIRWPTDIYVTGLTYGYGIYTVPGGNTATEGNSVFLTDTGDTDGTSLQPFFSGAAITISGGAETSIGKN